MWVEAVLAQPTQPVIVGWLSLGTRESDPEQLAVFKRGLAALGYKEGPHFAIEGLWAESRPERLPSLAEQLAAKKPAVIVVWGSASAVKFAAKAAPGTPIVVVGSDFTEVEKGLVKSLARPGGTVTGVRNNIGEYREKFVELLLAAVPGLKRIGVLVPNVSVPSSAASYEAIRRSAAQHKVELRFEGAATVGEIEPALSRLDKQGVQALVVSSGQLFAMEAPRVVKLALARGWPLIGGPGFMRTESGALLSYGHDVNWQFLRVAHYVDRILKGAKPGDLPIEQPTKFELVVNLKTAKVLGLTIPQPFLMRADRVIE